MIPAMPAVTSGQHSRQNTYAALRFGRLASMGTVAALILIAGVWGSWGTAQHVMLGKGREQGTMTVTRVLGRDLYGAVHPHVDGIGGAGPRHHRGVGRGEEGRGLLGHREAGQQ